MGGGSGSGKRTRWYPEGGGAAACVDAGVGEELASTGGGEHVCWPLRIVVPSTVL